jgi:hypothetical protein
MKVLQYPFFEQFQFLRQSAVTLAFQTTIAAAGTNERPSPKWLVLVRLN